MAALSITAAQVLLISGQPFFVTWDATVTRGMPVRYAPSTGKWGPAQSDGSDATDAGLYGRGIALSDGSSGSQGLVAGPGCVVDLGAAAAAAAGTVYGAVATAGNLAPVADEATSGRFRGVFAVGVGSNRVQVVDYGVSATAIP